MCLGEDGCVSGSCSRLTSFDVMDLNHTFVEGPANLDSGPGAHTVISITEVLPVDLDITDIQSGFPALSLAHIFLQILGVF